MMVLVLLLRTVLPLPRAAGELCPPKHSSGAYCVPQSDTAPAVPRIGGSCPPGYASSGHWCLGRA